VSTPSNNAGGRPGRGSVAALVACVALLAGLLVACWDPDKKARAEDTTPKAWKPEPHKGSSGGSGKKRHKSHEHGHGSHPHGSSPHHHHPHPHPHLPGPNGHHHPY
jgi:hypothetical protein